MSRRIQHVVVARPDHTTPYQVTSLTNSAATRPHHHHHHHHHERCPSTSIDIGYSDATSDTYYDYNGGNFPRRHQSHRRDSRTDVTFSDESDSIRLPYYEFDDESIRRCTNNRGSISERSYRKTVRAAQRSGREIEEEQCEERLYHEIQTPCNNVQDTSNGRHCPSDRPQSSMSSALTSAMVYGCGGRCQTFESVCYFILQLMFTMGVLIGVSLCIAGLVLRKSAAKNLQVLVYIGVMLAGVSSLLLVIQCRAKNTARRRIKAIQTAKRVVPIPMETLNIRTNPVQNLERLPSVRETQHVTQLPQVHQIGRPLPQRPQHDFRSSRRGYVPDHQGVPWWRRTEDIII